VVPALGIVAATWRTVLALTGGAIPPSAEGQPELAPDAQGSPGQRQAAPGP
jgi:hypothetical protein